MTDQTSLSDAIPSLLPELEPPQLAAAETAVALAPIAELAEGRCAGVWAVKDRQRLSRRNGSDFLKLVLRDRTGTVEAKVWDDVEACHGCAEPGAIVRVEGQYSVHPQYGASIKVDRIRTAAPGEYDLDDLIASGDIPIERLEAGLRDLLATIHHPDLVALLDRVFGEDSEIWARFREAPAAKHYHQAFRHGLLEHTLSVAEAVSAAASAFPGVDREVAVTGALLHDIGKLQAYNDDPFAIDLTDAGRLQGEIPLGYFFVRTTVESIDGFDPALGQAIFHIILSHHGSLEHGSPVVPATREATLVHMMDNLGGTLGSFDRIEAGLREGEAWSRFDRGISSSAYFPARAA
ncbi:HD domain-containing protein [Thermoleophilia bacterium SCSIO 60948]|nr:HD domain-containing protein [Thermoleophilia bacterium SCSIO 60948]